LRPAPSPLRSPCASRSARGFTLLEMLVVLLIVGIVSGVATLALSRNPRTDLHEQGERLALLFESASDEAQVRGRPLAWEANDRGYAFSESSDGDWRLLRDPMLGQHAWSVPLNGIAIRYTGSSHDANRLVFGVESIEQPVTVTLYAPFGQVRIVSNGNGRYFVQ